MNRRTFISLAVGFLFSAAAMILALRNVPFGELTSYMRAIDYRWILPSLVIIIICFVLRTWRWQVILGSFRRIGFWQAYHPMMIGFMINCILPGRAGEVARPLILQHKEKVPFTTGLTTVAAERLMDAGMLLLLFAAVGQWVEIDPSVELTFGEYRLNRDTLTLIGSGLVRVCLILIAAIILLSFSRFRQAVVALIQKAFSLAVFTGPRGRRFLQERVAATLIAAVEHAGTGVALVREPLRIGLCLLISFCIWVLAAVAWYTLSLGCPGVHLSLFEMGATMIIVMYFIALPSVPGFWGIWEAGGVFALSLFAVGTREAAGFTLVNHAVQVLPVILAGLISALWTGVSIFRLPRETKKANGEEA